MPQGFPLAKSHGDPSGRRSHTELLLCDFGISTLVPQQAVGCQAGVLQHCTVGLTLSMPRCVPGGAAVGTGLGSLARYSALPKQSLPWLCPALGLPMGLTSHWQITPVGAVARGW